MDPTDFVQNRRPVRLGRVYNDKVSSPESDATDWKSIVTKKRGKITARLHWDNEQARLQLNVYDALGKELKRGKRWGRSGRTAVLSNLGAGKYYVRVHATGDDDESTYSLKVAFAPSKLNCVACTIGDKVCVGEKGFGICVQRAPGCLGVTKQQQCSAGQTCRDGACVKACAESCKVGARRCMPGSRSRYQTCRQGADGCPEWQRAKKCRAGKQCYAGRCRSKKPKKREEPAPRPPAPPPTSVKGKIISMYGYRGRTTLHIEIGDAKVTPGQVGVVLKGSSKEPLPGGKIRVTKVTGKYCIATTSLKSLGKNRWVQISTR